MSMNGSTLIVDRRKTAILYYYNSYQSFFQGETVNLHQSFIKKYSAPNIIGAPLIMLFYLVPAVRAENITLSLLEPGHLHGADDVSVLICKSQSFSRLEAEIRL